MTAIKDYNLGIEINHTCISEDLDTLEGHADNSLINRIKKDLDYSKPSSLILHGPFTEIHPAAIDYKARILGMDRLNQAYRVCSELSCKHMVVHSGWLPFIYFKSWQVEKSCEFWNEFLSDKDPGFNIYIENVLEDEPFLMLDTIKAIANPRVKICLDIGHANAMTKADNIYRWIEVLAPYIGHFHLHNNDGTKDSHSCFSQGTMDMDLLFKTVESFCSDELTFTIEAHDATSCINWLLDKGYL